MHLNPNLALLSIMMCIFLSLKLLERVKAEAQGKESFNKPYRSSSNKGILATQEKPESTQGFVILLLLYPYWRQLLCQLF